MQLLERPWVDLWVREVALGLLAVETMTGADVDRLKPHPELDIR